MDEFTLIDHFFERAPRNPQVALSVGDDAALLDISGRLAVTTDTLLAGVHFPHGARAFDVGYKALAVNLSDLAAMGARPRFFLLNLSVPAATEAWLADFSAGLFALADVHGVDLIGGDTVRGPLGVTITALGELPPGTGLTRGGAQAGDRIYVTGHLGEAALGFSHRQGRLDVPPGFREDILARLDRPVPRCREGMALLPLASAAIDISDGLAADLAHMMEASGTGAEIDLGRLPLSAAYAACFAAAGWDLALAFGDDYELCFTLPRQRVGAFEALRPAFACGVHHIGDVVATPGVRWSDKGEPYEPARRGFNHFG
ncbi:MAG: thiamine-phosphate kinase [Gammaproteobacteria bacterium]|nr:thiamine-phosphate kinase [Gammaproteobacteria bacterium]